MSGLKKAVVGLVALLLLLVMIGFILPAEFKVQRSIVINAPASKIFPHVADLQNWENWGVWFKRDPRMLLEYSGPQAAVGMRSRWLSDSQGNGEMEIIALEQDHRLIYSLRFPDIAMESTGELVLKPLEQGVEVIWLDYGNVGLNPFKRYLAAFMDSLVGGDFEMGLENLKMVAEAS